MNRKFAWFRSLPFWLASRLIILHFARRVTGIPVNFSYAQGAEDTILSHIARYHFNIADPGNFVDVGCNLPVRYSNTFELYLRGWRGLNIDANTKLIAECKRVRKQDISIVAAVSDSVREVTFHKAKDHSVSTIDEQRLVEWKSLFEFADEDQETIITRTLTSILDEFWPTGRPLDMLSIDVEGHDLSVIRGLDLTRYRPKIIVIEMHEFRDIEQSAIMRYLMTEGYSLKFFAVLNAYFVDDKYGEVAQ